MANLKELSKRPERLASGHRMCIGCGVPIGIRQILLGTDKPVVVGTATGCLEVCTTIYPYTSWKVPWIHNAFENVAATMSGVETAHRVLAKQGKAEKDVKFVAFGGDGGTYDIGLQSLSGTLERGHNVFYVCYDNEAYMNTGIQRSSATPFGASTKTDPAGQVRQGKQEFKKDLTKVVAAHNIPYVCQASIHNYNDTIMKATKAFETLGPSFMNILTPCTAGWVFPYWETVKIAKLATDICFWPLDEIENGQWKLNYDPGERKVPVTDWLKPQRRFAHLFRPGNEDMLKKIQEHVDKEWEELKKRCSAA
ncbi:pyruvate ferredoxin oxidoreductase [Candidatus Woesearchaeota archaeon]|nr:pyruvate ferredoxin oxidoreductase [Candidatus Woesearchaeota archaeon]